MMNWFGVLCFIAIVAAIWLSVRKNKATDKAGGWTEEDCLGQLKELSHDYATLGTLVEDFHQDISTIQKELFQLDERLSKLEIRSTTIRIGLSQMPWSQESADYVGPDEEDLDDDGYGDVATYPQPLTGWLDLAKGLDEL